MTQFLVDAAVLGERHRLDRHEVLHEEVPVVKLKLRVLLNPLDNYRVKLAKLQYGVWAWWLWSVNCIIKVTRI